MEDGVGEGGEAVGAGLEGIALQVGEVQGTLEVCHAEAALQLVRVHIVDLVHLLSVRIIIIYTILLSISHPIPIHPTNPSLLNRQLLNTHKVGLLSLSFEFVIFFEEWVAGELVDLLKVYLVIMVEELLLLQLLAFVFAGAKAEAGAQEEKEHASHDEKDHSCVFVGRNEA